MTEPATYNITVYSTVPYVQQFQLKDAAEDAIDITGYDFNMDVRQYGEAATAQVELATVESSIEGVQIITAASGLFEVRIDQTTLAAVALPNPAQPNGDQPGAPGLYYYDLMVTPSGGDGQLYLSGTFTILPGVTAP
jgi:hypothetical protein